MLTLKNICKTYHTKGGADVKALDDVSLTFPETGMVFLLGKSGSGKSTLLNVCGGLDSADSGEIIILGRSSATFSGSDFDSYRNTFVGFIFQEYNILNEFSVEENLALALELQGKGKDKAKVRELLRQVDMEGYAKRKPNTLSGGQKQRIAIARALIKDPKIIMADEPTGALDSTTGKQVLDTLKALSKTRLVIVVSHDREFAEIYGDRVIELKDGKVISDVSKKSFAAEKMGENISVIAGETLSVKCGKNLSDDELMQIRDYIRESDGDIIISRSKNDITSFKKVNRIADDGSSEHFETTDAKAIATREYTAAESALVRSKLPLGKAIKMGASSLKVKKFRLFLTILLSVIAFIMFGIFSTLMTYNGDTVLINSYAQSDYDTIDLIKTYNVTQTTYKDDEEYYKYTYYYSTKFTDDDITALRESFGADVIGILQLASGSSTVYNVSTSTTDSRTLTSSSIKGVGYAPEESSYRKILAGKYPTANDEVAISEWYYELLKAQTFYSVDPATSSPTLGEVINVNSMEDVIGQYLCVSVRSNYSTVYTYYKIAGVYNGGDIPSAYSGWNDAEQNLNWEEELLDSYESYIDESMQNVLLVCDTFCDNFIATYGKNTSSYSYTFNYDQYFKDTNYYYNDDTWSYLDAASVYDATSEYALPVYWLGEEKSALSDGEVILNISSLQNFLNYSLTHVDDEIADRWKENYTKKYGDLYIEAADNSNYYYYLYELELLNATLDYDKIDEYFDLYTYYSEYESAYYMLMDIENVSYFADYLSSYTKYYEFQFDNQVYIDLITDYLNNYCPVSLKLQLYDGDGGGDTLNLEIVGFHGGPGGTYNDGVYLSQATYERIKATFYTTSTTKFVESDDAIYSYAYVKYDGSQSLISTVLDKVNEVNADDSSVSISSDLYFSVTTINELVSILKNVFLYAGIALAAFAALLLFNFISVSITNKTHEIGVLRAVGARGWDVFRIFFAEATIITLICLAISLIGTLILVSYLNSVMSAGLGFPYMLFSFGLVSLVMMLAVAAIVAFLGTFIPVFRISRKKPVDSMRSF